MDFLDAELEAYLDESLDPARAAEIEAAMKIDKGLVLKLSNINGRRDAGVHTLSDIWRRNQVGVPSREALSQFLLGSLTSEESDYIRFRIDVLKCRFTTALLADLKSQKSDAVKSESDGRRKKLYQSGAGIFAKKKGRK